MLLNTLINVIWDFKGVDIRCVFWCLKAKRQGGLVLWWYTFNCYLLEICTNFAVDKRKLIIVDIVLISANRLSHIFNQKTDFREREK